MELNNIINTLELYYKQYSEQNSENTFNAFTDFFFDKLNSIPLCKQILDEVANYYDINNEDFEKRQQQDIFNDLFDIFNKGEKYYVAYCYKYYHFLRKNKESGIDTGETYYDDVGWTNNGNMNNCDKIKQFKTDFVLPIVNYLTGNIRQESIILHYLRKYKERVERFKSLKYSQELNELSLQRDLALFLFDQQLDFAKEIDTCDGRIDFKIDGESEIYGSILECNEKPYIIEIKYFNKKEKLSTIEKSKGQLKVYMEQVPSYGCLLIYTTDETDFDLSNLSDDKITVLSVYIGENTPSKRIYSPSKEKHLIQK